MIDRSALAAGRDLWARIAGAAPPEGSEGAPEAVAALARRLAAITAPSLAHGLLGDAVAGAVTAEEAERSRQLNRYLLASARRWLTVIEEAAIPVVALKGLATAHRFYPDPLIRGMGDVDILVRGADVAALVATLGREGFRFRRASGTPPWGLISDASFHPFVAPDGGLALDIHVQPDDAPVHRSLGCEDVFARARPVDFEGGELLVPANDHLVLLAVTNAARDKFAPPSLRSMIDLAVGLGRANVVPDWALLASLASEGRFAGSLNTALALLAAIGVAPSGALPRVAPSGALPRDAPSGALPRDAPSGAPENLSAAPRGAAGLMFGQVVDDYLTLFARTRSKLALQLRDAVLISATSTVTSRNLRRLRGLIRPWPGVPENAP